MNLESCKKAKNTIQEWIQKGDKTLTISSLWFKHDLMKHLYRYLLLRKKTGSTTGEQGTVAMSSMLKGNTTLSELNIGSVILLRSNDLL